MKNIPGFGHDDAGRLQIEKKKGNTNILLDRRNGKPFFPSSASPFSPPEVSIASQANALLAGWGRFPVRAAQRRHLNSREGSGQKGHPVQRMQRKLIRKKNKTVRCENKTGTERANDPTNANQSREKRTASQGGCCGRPLLCGPASGDP